MLTIFIHGMNMLQQNAKTTTLLIFPPYSAQTRIVVKARVRMRSHVNTRSVTVEPHTSNYEQIREVENALNNHDSLAAEHTCAVLGT